MAPRKTKKFIDKKNALQYQFVHRSQTDQLVDDNEASKFVLMPLNENARQQPAPFSTSTTSALSSQPQNDRRAYNLLNLGFDDDFDYSQYMMSTGPGQGFVHVAKDQNGEVSMTPLDHDDEEPTDEIAQPVFSSHIADDVLPQELLSLKEGYFGDYYEGNVDDMDSDVEAIIFDGKDDVEELEDDFVFKVVEMAQNDPLLDEMSDEEFSDDDVEPTHDDVAVDDVSLLEKQIEHAMEYDEYDDESEGLEVGEALELFDIDLKRKKCNDFKVTKGEVESEVISRPTKAREELLKEKREKEELIKKNEYVSSSSSEIEDIDPLEEERPKSIKFDCQSIVSTYSNVYHHPQTLEDPFKKPQRVRISSKTGAVKGHTDEVEGQKSAESEDEKINEGKSLKKVDKNTRKMHKKLIKEQKQVKRSQKKALKQLFAQEQQRMAKAKGSGSVTVL
ncbi:hypothetical protein P9112_009499 [Eukaryota sp. TZLM1-RC]